jgi:transposase
LERRRRKAAELMKRGYHDAAIARRLNTTRQSVGRWRKLLCCHGAAALTAKPVPGRPPGLSPQQRRGLVARLLKGPLAYGFATDLWTCPRIAQMIEACYGVRYHVDHIPRLMAGLGFSCQKPERRAIERDEAAIRRWIDHDWPRIKKRQTQTRSYRFHR